LAKVQILSHVSDRKEAAMTWTIASKIVRRVVTIDGSHSTLEAATLMAEEFVGSAVITSSSKITGIFTERDLMMRVVGKKRDPDTVKINEVMTKEVVIVSPKDTANYCLNLMKEHRCRHLLVFDGDEFVGIVSLRDMVALLMEEKEDLIAYLHQYISS
jgi:CBS domain-containing protein